MPDSETKDDSLSRHSSLTALRVLAEYVKKQYGIDQKQLIRILEQRIEELAIPLSVFELNPGLSILELVCKYLKENLNLTYHQIAQHLNRNDRTIWTTYKNAIKKQTKTLRTETSLIQIPVSIFYSRKLSVLESIVFYLSTQGFSVKNIAITLNRDYRTIWITNKKVMKKQNEKR